MALFTFTKLLKVGTQGIGIFSVTNVDAGARNANRVKVPLRRGIIRGITSGRRVKSSLKNFMFNRGRTVTNELVMVGYLICDWFCRQHASYYCAVLSA